MNWRVLVRIMIRRLVISLCQSIGWAVGLIMVIHYMKHLGWLQ